MTTLRSRRLYVRATSYLLFGGLSSSRSS